MKLTLLAALSGALLLSSVAYAPVYARQLVFDPTTAAGGAIGTPEMWDQMASYRFVGVGSSGANVNVSPEFVTSTTDSVTYDQSTHPTTVAGDLTNVTANTQQNGANSSVSVSTVPGH